MSTPFDDFSSLSLDDARTLVTGAEALLERALERARALTGNGKAIDDHQVADGVDHATGLRGVAHLDRVPDAAQADSTVDVAFVRPEARQLYAQDGDDFFAPATSSSAGFDCAPASLATKGRKRLLPPASASRSARALPCSPAQRALRALFTPAAGLARAMA